MNKETLDKYVEDGWLIKQNHPLLPLTIYNYSQATQYEGKWDEITLGCRGLILDDNGKVIARPFSKFFNLEENRHSPTETFTVYEKLDGSLGIVFWYNDEWHLASRGSFTSEQAIRGKAMLDSKYNTNFLSSEFTYLFEIIYPENRIVVDYGDMEKLIMIGEIETETGIEYNSLSICDYEKCGFDVVKTYDAVKDFNQLKAENWHNKEGFVIKFSNGDRCKIKFEDYVTLHKIITNVSSYDIWENLKSFGKLDEDLLTQVPDEFYEWVRKVESDLKAEYKTIEDLYEQTYNNILSFIFVMTPRGDQDTFVKHRAEFAKLAKSYNHPGILFAMYDGKDYSQMIWKMIKPKYEKPFSKGCLES